MSSRIGSLSSFNMSELEGIKLQVEAELERKKQEQRQQLEIEEFAASRGYKVTLTPLSQPTSNMDNPLPGRKEMLTSFWKSALPIIHKVHPLSDRRTAPLEHWFGVPLGMAGVSINLVAIGTSAHGEVYINLGDKQKNKAAFDFFSKKKGQIESLYGKSLTWERMPDRVTSRIKSQSLSANVYNQSDWPKIAEFLGAEAKALSKAFVGAVQALKSR